MKYTKPGNGKKSDEKQGKNDLSSFHPREGRSLGVVEKVDAFKGNIIRRNVTLKSKL